MKLLLFLALLPAVWAQNPNPCSQIRNTAVAGQVLSAVNSGPTPPCQWITGGGGGGGGGTVTSIATSNGITGGPITTTGTISGVNAAADGTTKGVSAFTAADFNATTGVISLDYTNGQKASAVVPGFLSSADWTTFNGKGAGSVTSVGLAGTANQIVVTGATPITGSGSWTLSLSPTLVLPNGTSGTTQSAGDNSTKVATTAYVDTAGGSFVPTSRTISTSSPLGGGGALSSNLTLTCATCVLASSPGVGIAHFAGSTQSVTSSLIVAADITSATITGTQIASSIALAGSPTTTTQSPGDNSTKIATTAYVNAATGSSGALVLLEQHTASSIASLDFTTCISSTYDEYQIHLLNIIPATDNTKIGFRMSTDGGLNYDSGTNYYWSSFATLTSGTGPNGATADTQMNLTNGASNATTNLSGFSAVATLIAPANTSLYKNMFATGSGSDDNSRLLGWWTSASYKSATAVNAFQVRSSSGNLASGIVRCYGVAK